MDFYRKKVFPALAECLWLVFLFLDLTGTADSTWVKFTAVCLCCVTALLGGKTADGRLVALALCLTVAADWFLLVRNDHYTLGVGLFILVQLLYAFRLYRLRGDRPCRRGLTVRLLIPAVGIFLCAGFVLWLIYSIISDGALSLLLAAFVAAGNLTVLPALFYFVNLCVNAAEAWALKQKGPRSSRNTCFAWGLLLFILCDICVGAFNLGLLTSFTWWGSWLFYLPSQVLIVRSQETESGDAP